MAKPQTDDNPIREMGTETRYLPCRLTDAELLEYGQELGTVIQDIHEEEDRQASLKQELKSKLAALEARQTELSSKITRREEVRNVDVRSYIDFSRDKFIQVRLDSGEEIKARPITADERQTALDLPEKGA